MLEPHLVGRECSTLAKNCWYASQICRQVVDFGRQLSFIFNVERAHRIHPLTPKDDPSLVQAEYGQTTSSNSADPQQSPSRTQDHLPEANRADRHHSRTPTS